MAIRFIETGEQSAAMNMAIDEALMMKTKVPVLRIYGWKPSAVSIGYFQGMEQEVNIKECQRRGIDVVRRVTGGGSVFHDSEITYSFITRAFPKDIMDSYKLICSAIIKGLNAAGIPAEFSKINDITIEGKKISGNAQTRKDGALLQHGTLLLDTNIEKMFTVLKVPKEKLKDKNIKDVKERVAPLKMSKNEALKAIKSGFSKVFGTLEESKLTMEELSAAAKLSQEKYSRKEWNFRR